MQFSLSEEPERVLVENGVQLFDALSDRLLSGLILCFEVPSRLAPPFKSIPGWAGGLLTGFNKML